MLYKELSDRFSVEQADFRTIDEQLKMKIRLDNDTMSNDVLQYLSTQGQVLRFNEVIPTVNDIFIKTITAHE